MSTSVEELKEKIERVKQDLRRMESSGETIEKLNILNDYMAYLQHELEQKDGRQDT